MKTFCLEVSGPYACFTRPEMKVERVSYDVITPSAARAIFDAILWKPAMRWHVRKIGVLEPVRWMSLRRNEVGGVVPVGSVKCAMKRGQGGIGFYVEDDRQQRAGLFLRDVAYRLYADLEVRPSVDPHGAEPKFWEMFERRARKGQCVNQPYLGCREFACDFRLVSVDECADTIAESRDLGWMLYDMDFSDPSDPRPQFFHASLVDGVVRVPPVGSPEVRA